MIPESLADHPGVRERAAAIYRGDLNIIRRQTDQMIACLLVAQWIVCIGLAVWISPLTWIGQTTYVHEHVYAAVFLGGIIMLPAAALGYLRPGDAGTRYCIAIAQMLASALLIHITGGRIESHFHVFGSLAFLAYYRDWRVLLVSALVVAIDHFLRGVYWPQSVFGVLVASEWRWLEHAFWVVFEVVFLVIGSQRGLRLFREIALRRAELEASNGLIEQAVVERTGQLASANRSLKNELERRTRVETDLKRAKEAADAANSAKSQFLANMSHEVRTPLNGMLGMNSLLLDSPLDSQQRLYARTLKACTESFARVVDDILDFASIDSKQIKLGSEPFSLRATIEAALALHHHSAAAKGLRLECSVAKDVPDRFVGDGSRIRQVLSNLVSNGIKFTTQGEVIVAVANGGPPARNAAEIPISISVRDTGMGIPADRVDQLFREFEQLDGSMTRRFGGTGLGLAIVKRVTELMNGSVSVSSETGAGSTFRVSLPLKTEASAPAGADQSTAESATPAGGNSGESDAANAGNPVDHLAAELPLRILLTEDNPVNQMVACRYLEKLGYACDVANNGAEAVSALERTAYDIVFMDVQMPVMDGYRATAEIVSRHGDLRPQIIALTAHASADDRRACLDCGMDDFMTKPIELEVLGRKLREAAARRHRAPAASRKLASI